MRDGIHGANPAIAEIEEEVFADVLVGKLARDRIVKGAADHCAAFGVGSSVMIGVNRVREGWVGGRRRIDTFHRWPSVISAAHDFVHFLPSFKADIVQIQTARARLEGKGVGTANAERPNRAVFSRGRIIKRVVRRDRPIGVDAHHLAKRRVQALRRSSLEVLT